MSGYGGSELYLKLSVTETLPRPGTFTSRSISSVRKVEWQFSTSIFKTFLFLAQGDFHFLPVSGPNNGKRTDIDIFLMKIALK